MEERRECLSGLTESNGYSAAAVPFMRRCQIGGGAILLQAANVAEMGEGDGFLQMGFFGNGS